MMKKPELLSVGAWAPIDHLFCMDHYPEEGETITVHAERDNSYFGDCSFNIAVVAGMLGIHTGIASVVGEDFAETGYETYLEDRGIDTRWITKVPGEPCGHNYLYFDREGQGFCFSQLGAAKRQDEYLLTAGDLDGIPHVIVSEKFGAYTLQALRTAKEKGAVTYINGMVDTAAPELLEEFLKYADIIFINRSEYQRLRRKVSEEKLFCGFHIEKIFVTDGKRGCSILTEHETRKERAVLTDQVKDTTGAGDSFAAGVIAALMKGFDDLTAVRVGAVVSSLIVREWGCQTGAPSWERMKQEYIKTFSEEEML